MPFATREVAVASMALDLSASTPLQDSDPGYAVQVATRERPRSSNPFRYSAGSGFRSMTGAY
jgi:hypothetical protein